MTDQEMAASEDDAEFTPWYRFSTGEIYFDECEALGHILSTDEALFVSGDAGPFWRNNEPDGGVPASIWANCNDLFMWGCSDATPLPEHEIESFYIAWRDHREGEWCCLQRGMQPQSPVRKTMKEAGTWTAALEALPKNPDDKEHTND